MSQQVQTTERQSWQQFQVELETRATEIGSQLPSTISRDRFINASIAAVKQTPAILMATPRSLFAALTKAAQDGLLPDGREGVITVFNQKIPNTNPAKHENVAQWNPMTYGLRKRARELDGIIIDAQVVMEGDEFEYEQGDTPRIYHRPAPRGEDQTKAAAGVAVYAIFRHPTEGILHREVMWKHEVFAVMNQSRAKTSLMWTTFWTEGWRKTVIRRGNKSVPVSQKLEQIISRVDEDFAFNEAPKALPQSMDPPDPPDPPEPPEPPKSKPAAVTAPKKDPAPPAPIVDDMDRGDEFDPVAFLEEIETALVITGDLATLEEVWSELDAPAVLDGSAFVEDAQKIYDRHVQRIERANLTAAGQHDMFGGEQQDGDIPFGDA